ncbi:MAG TPA: NADH-quinone oxidoreductase subunit C [Myxococcota bacterium]|jgi:NADH-quinone oxidoreductase subunit C|nr:NADH-quinone oxidoreductase subunit C [Myxococcota bacterium]
MEDFGSLALRRLLEAMPAAVHGTHAQVGDATALVRAEDIVPVMRFLRDTQGLEFDMLTDLTCVDHFGETPRFEMVYHLYSVAKNHRLRVKARVPEEKAHIDTLIPVWPAANWLEREVWDMYGIRFHGHPDLRRLLLYEEFQGHPLRKDYPKEKRQPLVGPGN